MPMTHEQRVAAGKKAAATRKARGYRSAPKVYAAPAGHYSEAPRGRKAANTRKRRKNRAEYSNMLEHMMGLRRTKKEGAPARSKGRAPKHKLTKAESAKGGRVSAAHRKRMGRAVGYAIDARAGHSFGPSPVSLRHTAEKKARRQLEADMYGTPKEQAAALRRMRARGKQSIADRAREVHEAFGTA